MAESGELLHEDQFCCPVCLDLLKDPVTVNCGHSYCMDCVKSHWDEEDRIGVYSCPQCRQTFTPRPVLGRNTMLAEVVEKLKKTGLQAAPPGHCYAGSGDVVCDVCTGRKLKAVKSCLVCLASYCETHLKLHKEHRHKMINSIGKLQDKICSRHKKLLEFYCHADQQCICFLCKMLDHRGHDTVSAAAGMAEKQKELQQSIQRREEEAEELRQAVDSLTRSAQAAVENTDSIFTEMIRSIEKRRSELKDEIRTQEKAAVSRAEGLLEQLEQEIAELRRRHSELEDIAYTEDHIHFLQTYKSLVATPGTGDLPKISVNSYCSFSEVSKSLSEVKHEMEQILSRALTKVTETVRRICILRPATKANIVNLKKEQILPIADTKNRAKFLQYACQLTLDPNTVHKQLRLSERNTVVTWVGEVLPYPDHKERFDSFLQVLCKESLTGRCYWEVQWSGTWVHIAVSYKGINRKRGDSKNCLGRNNKSWSLYCSSSYYFFRHNNEETAVSPPTSSTIGVSLDHKAGTLSFYSVSDTMTLLHRVQTTFTEPLYPAFFVYGRSSVKLLPLTTRQKSD